MSPDQNCAPRSRNRTLARLSLLAGASMLAVAAWGQSQLHPIDIAAQPMDKALNALARQSGARIVFSTDLMERHAAPALKASLTVEEALDRLLAGSDLQAMATPGGGFTIVRRSGAGDSTATNAGTSLAAVTVLGTREANVPLSNVPSSISVITRDEIQTALATSSRIEDVIAAGAPGFNPTNNGVRQIRGRTAQVFVNGVPLNEQLRASAAADINLLAPDQIDSVEVARGANSAYGFGSPGGIIALNTPRAESEQLTLKSKVSISANTGHVGSSHQTGIYQSVSRIVGDFDYHVGLSARKDGLGFDPDGKRSLEFDSPLRQANSKDNFVDLDTSLGYNFGGSAGQLRLAVTAGRADVDEAFDSDFLGIYRQTQSSIVRTPAGDANSRQYHTLNLTYENLRVGDTAFKFEAVSSRTQTRAFDAFGAPVNLDEQTNQYAGLRSSATTGLNEWHRGATLTWGLDVLRNRYFRPYTDAATGDIITFFSPDVTLDTVAPYLQTQWPVGNWRFSGGVRHERYRGNLKDAVDAGGPVGGDIRPFNLTLFNAGVVYNVHPGREWYGSFSQGAEISQLGRDSGAAGSALNLDPQPAKSNQYEIGLRQRSSGLEYGVAAFYTESDLLSALQCDGISPCVPLREPREFWGLEATTKWRVNPRLAFGGSVSWTEGLRTLASGEKRRIGSRDAPPLLLSANVEHSPKAGWKNRLQVDYRASRNPFGDSTAFGEGRVDSVVLAHVSASFAVGPGQLQVGIRNLFDRKYFAIPVQADNVGFYFIPEQGRRLAVSYALTW